MMFIGNVCSLGYSKNMSHHVNQVYLFKVIYFRKAFTKKQLGKYIFKKSFVEYFYKNTILT